MLSKFFRSTVLWSSREGVDEINWQSKQPNPTENHEEKHPNEGYGGHEEDHKANIY